MVATPVQQSQTISVTYGTDGSKIVSGSTTPGATNWQQDGNNNNIIVVTIDTSAAKFTNTPIYVTSLVGFGGGEQIGTTGASSVYNPTPTSFFIAIRWEKDYKDEVLTPEIANSKKWHINWIAIEPAQDNKVAIFAAIDFGGASQELGVGSYDLKDLSIGGDVLSSLKVPAGYKVTLYENPGFQGKSKTFTSDANFVGEDFNDKTSSIRIERIQDSQPAQETSAQPSSAFPTPGKDYYLISKHSGKPIAVDGASTANGAKIVQWDNQKVDHFKFQLQDAGNGYYYIVAKHSGKGFAVNGVSKDNGANVVQWEKVSQDNHKFKLQDAGEGYFYIIPKHSGKTVAVYGLTKDNNVNVVQWDLANQNNHKWKFEAV